MSNERLLQQQQQSVKFTEIVDSEMEQISGGNCIIPIFNPCGFNGGHKQQPCGGGHYYNCNGHGHH